MIDDNWAARLDVQTVGDIDNYRYSAPEIQFPRDHGMSFDRVALKGDVYGIGMIAYEVSFNLDHPAVVSVEPYTILGLDGECSVLRIRRCRCVVKYPSRENTSTTL